MIGRAIHALTVLVACFCVATVIALGGGAAWLVKTGKLDRSKLAAMVAVAEGKVLPAAGDKESVAPEPVLPQDLADARSLQMRNLELREQSLASALEQLRFERGQLADETGRFEMVQSAFQKKLDEMTEGLSTGRRETVRLTWESMKPKQAKEQVMLMLDDGRMNDVVTMLAAMPVAKRAKIAAEFKTPDEARKLAQILQRMREGAPDAEAIDAARQDLEKRNQQQR